MDGLGGCMAACGGVVDIARSFSDLALKGGHARWT